MIRYSSERDLAMVDQFGFVDLRDAFRNNAIPSDLGVSAEDYNGIDNPDNILGRPSAVFDGIKMLDAIRSASVPSTSSDSPVDSGEN